MLKRDLIGELVIKFTIPGEVREDLLQSLTFGGETAQRDAIKEIEKSILPNKDQTTFFLEDMSRAFTFFFNNSVVTESEVHLTSFREPEKKCPACNTKPTDPGAACCSRCGATLIMM